MGGFILRKGGIDIAAFADYQLSQAFYRCFELPEKNGEEEIINLKELLSDENRWDIRKELREEFIENYSHYIQDLK